ncbi:hydrolase/acyltransferase [Paenibacillus herberti]|uniref:Hydrolase/acyltransferase n=1 Tax=Paenibacillus herberti TaxID=1619309 RepID=A0A229NTB1_9BACL|nr:hydrolase/acyltransferase [Paenibacillus herberti]OXM13137.1 hydrolase/acyltransferase [Paenibacillus herberti]
MPTMKYVLFQHGAQLSLVEMPHSHAYQLSALNLRLHKELDKLTAEHVPPLARCIAEFSPAELHERALPVLNGLDYLNELEETFKSIQEKSYPLISLLTEIRALQAQLEQWYEEEYEG